MPRAFTFAGRGFVEVVGSTALHDDFATVLIHDAGLAGFKLEPGESDFDAGVRLTIGVLRSGLTDLILGTLLVPEGVPTQNWNEAIARDTAKFLGALTDPADKSARNAALAEVLGPFWALAIDSSRSSLTSSRPVPIARAGTGLRAILLAIGARLFGRWRPTTTTARVR